MGALKIAPEYFGDFFRGVIDGDGSIYSWIHPTNKDHQLSLRIVSASEIFLDWLQDKSEKYFNVIGKTYENAPSRGRNSLYILKFGKIAAQIILNKCYYKNCLALDRKYDQALKELSYTSGWSRYKFMKTPGC